MDGKLYKKNEKSPYEVGRNGRGGGRLYPRVE